MVVAYAGLVAHRAHGCARWVPPRPGNCVRAGCALRWHPMGTDSVRRKGGMMTRPKPPDGATARITIVLPAEALERVKAMAEEIATPPSVLIRQWIMEHTKRAPATGSREQW